MGIPVLTSLLIYADAISSSILRYAGLEDHICHNEEDLQHARWLAHRYHSAASRRELAVGTYIPCCDPCVMPSMFVEGYARCCVKSKCLDT